MRVTGIILSLLMALTSSLCLGGEERKYSTLSIGPSGISLGATPLNDNLDVSFDKGLISFDFSITGSRLPKPPPAYPTRVQTLTPVPSTALTDSETFFKGVGKQPSTPSTSRTRLR